MMISEYVFFFLQLVPKVQSDKKTVVFEVTEENKKQMKNTNSEISECNGKWWNPGITKILLLLKALQENG